MILNYFMVNVKCDIGDFEITQYAGNRFNLSIS